jgi:hypothetical protein
MAYGSDGIRAGGGQAVVAGGTSGAAAQTLQAANCPAASFGQVTGADVIASALVRARDANVAMGQAIESGHVDLDARAQRTAADGDQLTVDTTAAARSGGPGTISAQMG